MTELTKQEPKFNLSPDELGKELIIIQDAIKLLQAYETGLSAEAMATLRKGERVTGYSLEQGFGRERWKVPAETIIELGKLMGIDLAKPVEVITPKQAITAGIQSGVVKEYSEIPIGELKLVRENSKDVKKKFGSYVGD